MKRDDQQYRDSAQAIEFRDSTTLKLHFGNPINQQTLSRCELHKLVWQRRAVIALDRASALGRGPPYRSRKCILQQVGKYCLLASGQLCNELVGDSSRV